MELTSLKNIINQLKTIIATAVEQITQAIALLPTTQSTLASTDMDTDVTIPTKPYISNPAPLDLPADNFLIKMEMEELTARVRLFGQARVNNTR